MSKEKRKNGQYRANELVRHTMTPLLVKTRREILQRPALYWIIILSITFAPLHKTYAELKTCDSCGAEYSIGDLPKSVLMRVELIGAVGRSGIFNVPKGTTLMTLLSAAGGVQSTADGEIIIKRKVSKGYSAATFDLDDIMNDTEKAAAELKPEDMVYVPHHTTLIGDSVFRTLSLITSIAGLVVTSILISDRLSGN